MKKTTILIVAIICSLIEYGIAQESYLYELGSKDSLYSSILEEQREFWVQLPESYEQKSNQLYPVVYVLDGEVHLQAVAAVLSYYWGGFMPEMIIVGISNRENRTRDLTTSEVQTRRGAAYHQETGGAENFTLFLEKELIPHIEASYPASSYRTLIGHSYAGLFTINMLVNHPGNFASYVAIDPSLDWDDQKLLKHARELLGNEEYRGKSLFMSLGGQLHMQNSHITIENVMQDSSDYTLFARSNIEFSNAVTENKQNGLNFQWKFYEQDLHGSISLPSILDGMIFLFNWYPIENTDKFNSPDTPTDELVQIIRKREKKLKDHFGYFVTPFDEELLIMLGYMNLEWGNTQKSLAFFQLALEYYPDSAEALQNIEELKAQNKP